MAAQITTALQDLKAQLLKCFPAFNCGYENVRLLKNNVALHDPTGKREFQDVRFNDMLGNYFWIEKSGDASVVGRIPIAQCEGTTLQLSQRFKLFSLVKGIDEAQFFECLLGCLTRYGCHATNVKLNITGGEYDTFAVLRSELQDFENVSKNIGNFAVSRIDFSLTYIVSPVAFGSGDCECEACNDC